MKKKGEFGVLGMSPYVSNGVPQPYLDLIVDGFFFGFLDVSHLL
jgi:hypothetical protein